MHYAAAGQQVAYEESQKYKEGKYILEKVGIWDIAGCSCCSRGRVCRWLLPSLSLLGQAALQGTQVGEDRPRPRCRMPHCSLRCLGCCPALPRLTPCPCLVPCAACRPRCRKRGPGDAQPGATACRCWRRPRHTNASSGADPLPTPCPLLPGASARACQAGSGLAVQCPRNLTRSHACPLLFTTRPLFRPLDPKVSRSGPLI